MKRQLIEEHSIFIYSLLSSRFANQDRVTVLVTSLISSLLVNDARFIPTKYLMGNVVHSFMSERARGVVINYYLKVRIKVKLL